jgi:PAS domain S-box-containing protein
MSDTRPSRPSSAADELAARLAAIIDSSNDAIYSTTLDATITSWNRAAERIFGWTAAEAIGRHVSLIIPADRRAEDDDAQARVRRGELVEHFETVRVTKEGRLIDVSLTVSPVRDAGGTIVGLSTIARDITERRHFDEARGRLAAIVDSANDVIVSKTWTASSRRGIARPSGCSAGRRRRRSAVRSC